MYREKEPTTSTIQRGLRELTADEPLAGGRTRRAGGGRKRAIDHATLLRDLDALVEPTAPGELAAAGRAHGRWRWRSRRRHTVVAELCTDLQPAGQRQDS